MIINVLRKSFLWNTYWLLAEKIFRICISVILWGKIAAKLGSSNFGVFSYFQAVLFILAPFWSLGINQIIRNQISLFPEKQHLFVEAGVSIKVMMTAVIFLLSFIYIQVWPFKFSHGTLIFYLFLFSYLFRSVDVIEFIFDSKIQSKFLGIIRSVAFVATAICYFIALYLKADFYWFVVIFSSEFLISGVLLIYLYKTKDRGSLNFTPNWEMIREIIKTSIPILLCDISITLFLRLNHVFLGNLLSQDSVAQFSVALRFTEVSYFIPSSILVTMFSPLSLKHEQSKENFVKTATFLFEIMVLLSLFIALVVFTCSEHIIFKLYGPSYLKAIPILKILVLSNVFMFWGIVQEPIDISKNILHWRLFRVATGALLNIALCYVFIKLFGTIGAAYATLATFFYAYFFSNFIYPKGREIFYLQAKSLLMLNTFSFIKARVHYLKFKKFKTRETLTIISGLEE